MIHGLGTMPSGLAQPRDRTDCPHCAATSALANLVREALADPYNLLDQDLAERMRAAVGDAE